MSEPYVRLFSEIGKLKRVLVHKPGKELERLVPQFLERMLFDDIPLLHEARAEHDNFVNIMTSNGTEVLYLENMLKETLQDKSVKENLIHDFCQATIETLGKKRVEYLIEYFKSLDTDSLIQKFFTGVLKEEVPDIPHSFYDRDSENPLIIDPSPNLFFTRDPAAAIGNGVSIHKMQFEARRKEALFIQYILKHHPSIKPHNVPLVYSPDEPSSVEGGDILVLSDKVLAVGVSQRTSASSIEVLAQNVFNTQQSFEKVYAVVLPDSRVFMHLDTVCNMVNKHHFIVHPAVIDAQKLKVYSLEKGSDQKVKIAGEKNFLDVLREVSDSEPVLIPCAGGGFFDAAREQWNDGSNTVAIAPGEVLSYARNEMSNKILEDHGIKVHTFKGAELVRGRGGAHCMTMPLYREDIK